MTALHSWSTCRSKPLGCMHAESLYVLGLGLLPPAAFQDTVICCLIPSLADLFVHSSHSSLSSFSYPFTRRISRVLPLGTRPYPWCWG